MQIFLKEKTSSLWKVSSILAIILAAVMFALFWYTQNIFWAGIYRLISFICFAGAVLSSLKVMSSGHEVEIHSEDAQLSVIYRKKGHMLLEETYVATEIKEIGYRRPSSMPGLSSGYAFFIRYEEGIRGTCFLQFAGRCLTFSEDSIGLLETFFDEFGIPVKKIH